VVQDLQFDRGIMRCVFRTVLPQKYFTQNLFSGYVSDVLSNHRNQ